MRGCTLVLLEAWLSINLKCPIIGSCTLIKHIILCLCMHLNFFPGQVSSSRVMDECQYIYHSECVFLTLISLILSVSLTFFLFNTLVSQVSQSQESEQPFVGISVYTIIYIFRVLLS